MCLTENEQLMIQTLYDYNRIPLWILDKNYEVRHNFLTDVSNQLKKVLSSHITKLTEQISNHNFDILCYETELYYMFSYVHHNVLYYVVGGPMLLSGFYHITDMKSLSFAKNISPKELNALIDLLPVISFTSFSSCLRIMMLLLKKEAPSLEEINNYKLSDSHNSLNATLIHNLFENIDDYRIHTPYSHELAVLNCVKEGNVSKLEATYKTLPQVKYGNMSNNPLKQFFYGCIANTTLITRYAIEGGVDEETAYTLSDVYIKQMEKCRTLYELNTLNEKMAIDFTRRVKKAQATKQSSYIRPISQSIDYIYKNIHRKITLDNLAKEVNLTPKYLSTLFKKETGLTLSKYIENKRMNEAKNLLIYSQYTCSQISNYLSFYSQSYFITIFKKNVGMTPNEYRKKYYKESWDVSE